MKTPIAQVTSIAPKAVTSLVQIPLAEIINLCEENYKRVVKAKGSTAITNDAWYTLFGVYHILPVGADREYVGAFLSKIQDYNPNRAS